jgi:hypothetical protein
MSTTGDEYHPRGKPFDDDYPDPVPGRDEVGAVREQVAALDSLRHPTEVRAQVEAMLARRSSRSPDRSVVKCTLLPGVTPAASPGVTPGASPGASPGVTPGGDLPVLVVTDEVLLRIDRIPALLWRLVRLLLTLLSWLQVPTFVVVRDGSTLSSIVVRLRPARPDRATDPAKLVAFLRRLGLDAGVSYCVTTSPVQKPRVPTPSSPPPSRIPAPARPAVPPMREPPSGEPATAPEEAEPAAGRPSGGPRAIAPREELDGTGRPAGAGRIVVAVIDTGLTAQRRSDGELRGVQGRGGPDPLDVFPGGRPNGFLDLAAGHGTFVAGIIAQIVRPVADRVELRVYRVADSDGVAAEFDLATAMIQAVADGAHLLNVSCGARTLDGGPAIALEAALEVIDGRAVVVAASGNLGGDAKMWPAGFAATHDNVISVASLKEVPAAVFPQPSAWACHGAWVKASAVGEGIRSTYVEGRTGGPNSVVFGSDSHARWSGTSFAAPQVTGGIARIAAGLLTNWQPGDAVALATGELLAAGVPLDGYGQALHILAGVTV